METEFEVLWSKESKLQFEKIIHFLGEEWTEREIKNFIGQLKRFENIVSKFPELYSESIKNPGLRRAVISTHNSVIYKIDWDHSIIRVYTIFDNRRNPNELKKL